MFSTISVDGEVSRVWAHAQEQAERAFIALSLLGELGEIDRIFTGVRHLGEARRAVRECWERRNKWAHTMIVVVETGGNTGELMGDAKLYMKRTYGW